MILDIKYYGDPILRKIASPVEFIGDEIKELVRNMEETMIANKGVGLAAPQVGVSLRIFISNIDFEDDAGEIHFGPTKVFINPVLTNASHTMVELNEGCLSIPGLQAAVSRPLSVDVEAQNLDGTHFKLHTERFLARCMMHENDHLNGTLFIDRIKGKRRNELEPHLKKVKQQFYDNV